MSKIIGLLGKSLTHSFSKQYFTNKFKNQNIDGYTYLNFELDRIDALPRLLQQYPNLIGFNVTIPYKQAVLDYVNQKDEIVEIIGAANTIKITPDMKLSAFNTDVAGFAGSLKPYLKKSHQRALILGTGGASKAVQYALKKMNIQTLVVSRTPQNVHQISYEQIDRIILKNYQIVVNASPLGMFPNQHTFPAFPYDLITQNHIFYDLIYNPKQTIFLKNAHKKGALTINGLEMLQLQAEASWEIWTKKSD